ncbi:GTPase-activating protein [Massospora cicadina]|nr:GTPase-activating protein [Massospora cicadina]
MKSVSSSASKVDISSFQPNHPRDVTKEGSSSVKAVDPQGSSSSSSQTFPEVSKKAKLAALLDSDIIDIGDLKKLAWGGLPPNQRGLSWKLLMGYLPGSRDRRAGALLRKRKEYHALRLALFEGSSPETQDPELWHQVCIDVPRTNPTLALFQQPRIRQVYALEGSNPVVFGTDPVLLVGPSPRLQLPAFIQEQLPEDQMAQDVSNLDTFSDEALEAIEADTFWCFSKLLDGIQDNYTSGQRGIQRQLGLMKYLIGRIDAQLAAHIVREDLHYVQFAFRWMNCLLMREFSFSHILRLWDAYMSQSPNGFSDFHVYVCASLLVKWSSRLQTMEFQEMIIFLQSLPTKTWTSADIELLLSEAFMWHAIFHNAPSHLTPDVH